MADKPNVKKSPVGLEEYLKIKEKRAKSKLNLYFPLLLKIILAVPCVTLTFLIIYFLVYLRFLPEH